MPHLQPRLGPNSRPFEHFHKTLPIKDNLHVDPAAWSKFRSACLNPGATLADIQNVPGGMLPPNNEPHDQSNFDPGVAAAGPAMFVSPMAAWSQTDGLAPDPEKVFMPAPPAVTSRAMAAEMNELYWMSALRDTPFNALAAAADGMGAPADINKGFNDALSANEPEIAALRDVPLAAGKANFTKDTIFRAGLLGKPGDPGELDGPFVSQFFLHEINYGAQLIVPTQVPYAPGVDYLNTFADWLLAQNTGLDKAGNAYSRDNAYSPALPMSENKYEHAGAGAGATFPRKYIRNMRDLCRFVNRDALHQAYFNAALLLNNWGAPLTPGNPVRGGDPMRRQAGFATLGGPDSLALVSWMACNALRTVWHQKWRVWLRMRPEAFGGIATIAPQQLEDAFVALQGLKGHTAKPASEGYLLPMAFSAGSPAHPSYGAGHASVAGACVTMLKAWFDGSKTLQGIFAATSPIDPPSVPLAILTTPDDDGPPPVWNHPDAARLTVEGELNKLAANVAMGRSMGGVHFRTDNTRSLRLGEFVTTVFLCNFVRTYKEDPVFDFYSFDGKHVVIDKGGVRIAGGAPQNAAQLLTQYNNNGHI